MWWRSPIDIINFLIPFKFDEQLNCNDVIIASLSVTLSNIPSIVAVAQTSPQNQTMQPMPTIKSTKTIAIGNNKI